MARTTIEFNDAADQELAHLTSILGVKSKTEIVRNALSLYAYLVGLLQQPGRALGIIDEEQGNRIEKVIVVPGVSRVQATNKTSGRVSSAAR